MIAWVPPGYTVGWTPFALLALSLVLLACSKTGRSASRNNPAASRRGRANRGVDRRAVEPARAYRRSSRLMASLRADRRPELFDLGGPRPRGRSADAPTRRARRPGTVAVPQARRDEVVVIDGVTFTRPR